MHLAFLINFLLIHSVGWFARDPSVLCQVGHALLNLSVVTHKRQSSLIFADDLFELSDIPKQKSVHVVRKAIESLSGCKFALVLLPSLFPPPDSYLTSLDHWLVQTRLQNI